MFPPFFSTFLSVFVEGEVFKYQQFCQRYPRAPFAAEIDAVQTASICKFFLEQPDEKVHLVLAH